MNTSDIVWDMETASEVSEHGQELGDLEVEVVNQELDVDVTMYTDTRNELLEDKREPTLQANSKLGLCYTRSENIIDYKT